MRTCLHILRVCLIAVSLTVTGWTALAAPEPWERRALDLPQGRLGWAERQDLREMRVLRLAMNVAPGLIVGAMSHSAPDVPRDVIAQALDDAAHGRPLGGTEQAQADVRRISGAKFLTVE